MIKFENDSCLIDTAYNIITCDDAFEGRVGKNALDNVLTSVDKRDLEKFQNAVQECLEGEDIYLCYRVISQAGRIVWVVAQLESGGVDDTRCIMIHFKNLEIL